jgi:hypothetical protein
MPQQRGEPNKRGTTKPRVRSAFRYDKMSPRVVHQVITGGRTFQVQIDPPAIPPDEDPEEYDDGTPLNGVRLKCYRALQDIELTVMTAEELRELKALIVGAFDAALLVAENLDERAAVAAEAGDPSYRRLWRPRPSVVRNLKVEGHPLVIEAFEEGDDDGR